MKLLISVSKRGIVCLLAMAICILLTSAAFAAEDNDHKVVGHVTHVDGSAYINNHAAKVGDPIYINDVVKTRTDNSKLKIMFITQVPLELSNMSSLAIDPSLVHRESRLEDAPKNFLQDTFRKIDEVVHPPLDPKYDQRISEELGVRG